jgi:uncharacterized protein (DUF2336 family)
MVMPPARVPLDSLVDLACRDGVDIRPTLLRVLTDLYVQKPAHSAEEETQYVELALGLIDAVDEQTRSAVTAILSTYPAAPRAVLLKLTGAALSTTGDQTRAEIENSELIDLFFFASPEERRLILANLDVTATRPTRRPIPIASELIRRLENAALQRNAGEYSRILERALGISRKLADRIVHDNSGEPIVVAAKALGIQAAVFQRILLFLNPVIGQSAQRVYELTSLFEQLNPAVAEHMLAIWRTTVVRKLAGHEPVYWNEERSGARALPTPARSRNTATRDRSRIKTGKP